MRRFFLALVLLTFFFVAAAGAKDPPRFKSVEIKHFPNAEGVELPPEFSDFLYAELKNELQKSSLFEELVGEGEVVETADAPRSMVLDGSVLEYKKGSVVKEQLIGFGAGMRSLRAQIKVVRRSDNQVMLEKELKTRASSSWDPKHLARFLAKAITGELKHNLKN